MKKAFAELEEGEEKIHKIQEFGIGQIRIGVSTTLCKYVLIPYLKRFIEKFPHIKIMISCQSTFHTVKLLEEEKIDIGLIGKYGFGKDMEFFSIEEIEDVFVASESYQRNLSLREKTANNPFDFFSYSNLLLLDEQNISRQHIENYFNENQLKVKQVLEVNSMDLLIEFAKIGLGVACVIKEFVKEELEEGVLSIVSIPNPIQKREIGFAYSKKNIKTESMERFMDFVLSPSSEN
ncbi:MAG: substrate-binding domain-containing protein [Velocimicrobium sp.]